MSVFPFLTLLVIFFTNKLKMWLLIQKVKVKSFSHAQLFVTPWTVARTKLLHPWDFSGKSTGVCCHFLQKILIITTKTQVNSTKSVWFWVLLRTLWHLKTMKSSSNTNTNTLPNTYTCIPNKGISIFFLELRTLEPRLPEFEFCLLLLAVKLGRIDLDSAWFSFQLYKIMGTNWLIWFWRLSRLMFTKGLEQYPVIVRAMHAKSLQSCWTLCDSMDYSLSGSSVHGLYWTRILKWIAMPSSRDLPDPEVKPASHMSPAGRFLPLVPPGKPISSMCLLYKCLYVFVI